MKNEFKVGDRVRIKSWDQMVKEFGTKPTGHIKCRLTFVTDMKYLCGRTATITDVKNEKIKLDFDDKSGDIAWSYSVDMIEPINQTIVIYRKGSETIALDKSTGKKAVAKCSPVDTYDFYEGAKLAFKRLTEPEVREVKRPAKAGEYIKIVNSDNHRLNKYENGDILLVLKSCEDGKAFYENGSGKFVYQKEYVVLEGYKPEKKEPEQEKLYNGKVVCVDLCGCNKDNYTVGKIYKFTYGQLICDDGTKLPRHYSNKIHSFKEWERFSSSKFVEIVE